MVAKLFLAFKNRTYYYMAARLGFVINYHIKYPPRGLKITPLLISTNRLVIEITKKDENLEKWLETTIRKTSYHGVETYIVVDARLLEPIETLTGKNTKIIPKYANMTGKYDLVATDLENIINIDNDLYIISEVEAWNEKLIKVASKENAWGVTGYADFLFESRQVLLYNHEEKKFKLAGIGETIEKNIGQIINHLKHVGGLKSLMLNEMFRFLYKAKHGDDTDIEDARIGLSVISLYIFYDV